MRIAPLLLKYDYGDKSRGMSNELKYFYPALQKIGKCYPLWLEEHQDINKACLEHIENIKPDLVFTCLMEYEIHPETLQKIKDKGIIVTNWFCDDQWRFEWSKTIAPSLSFSITTDKYALKKYRDLGHEARLVPWGATYIDKVTPQYKRDVSFVGTRDKTREWYLHDLPFVDCFGVGWESGKISDPAEIHGSSRISLNLSNSIPYDIRFYHYLQDQGLTISGGKRTEQIKARHFEIPAAGGFQLAHYTPGIEDYFEIGKEIAVIIEIDDIKKQIEYYLEHDDVREQIRIAGHKRAKEYTYDKILRRVLC